MNMLTYSYVTYCKHTYTFFTTSKKLLLTIKHVIIFLNTNLNLVLKY